MNDKPHEHRWVWQGGGISGRDFNGQMYCKKECSLCHLKKAIIERETDAELWVGGKRDQFPKVVQP
jgi:hypothetical protein